MLVRDGKTTMIEDGDEDPHPSPTLLQHVDVKLQRRRRPQRCQTTVVEEEQTSKGNVMDNPSAVTGARASYF